MSFETFLTHQFDEAFVSELGECKEGDSRCDRENWESGH